MNLISQFDGEVPVNEGLIQALAVSSSSTYFPTIPMRILVFGFFSALHVFHGFRLGSAEYSSGLQLGQPSL